MLLRVFETQSEFERAAFSTVWLDVHPKSLQLLLNISKRPVFKEVVKKVVFAH
jgi:hypothetical protein